MTVDTALRLLLVAATAIVAGIAIAIGTALIGHQVLVAAYGEAGIAAIDDTPPMFIAVATTYVAGFLTGLAIMFVGWRRVLRR